MGQIILVGTSHVAEESRKKVEKTIAEEEPECVAVELDLNRYAALKEGHRAGSFSLLRRLGPFTFVLYYLMKKVQDWVGGQVGAMPGAEMLGAVEVAQREDKKIAFIDRNLMVTFTRLKDTKTTEKLKLVWWLVKGLIGLGEKVEVDLSKVPSEELIEKGMQTFREEFPEMYKVLVEERNQVMVDRLEELSEKFEKTVAVVGAGHYKQIEKMVKEREVEVKEG